MEVHLTPEQNSFVRLAIDTGRFQREEDAVQEAMRLWENRERRRLEMRAAIKKAEASLERGEGRRVSTQEEMARLADDIRRRGMARLSAEQNIR
ncbi:MAG: ribbon-helix-helix domain-containing protein [Bryobacteraceae bacterium]